MSVVVKVADDRHANALLLQPFDNVRDGLGRIVIIDGDAHNFTSRTGECSYLLDRAWNIRRIGVGHRLHHHWCITADADTTNDGSRSFSTLYLSHVLGTCLPNICITILNQAREKRDDRKGTLPGGIHGGNSAPT